MSLIYFDNYNTLDLDPYNTFNKEFNKHTFGSLDGLLISINDIKDQDTHTGVFYTDSLYGKDFVLAFQFKEYKLSSYLINHTVRYSFDPQFCDIQLDSMAEINNRSKYFYIDGAEALDFTYKCSNNSMEMLFRAIAPMNKCQNVCNQLISHDIALFSRGW